MIRRLASFLAIVIGALASFPSPAAAQRLIAFDESYLPVPPDTRALVDGRAFIALSREDLDSESFGPERHMPFTLSQFRIRAPIGQIVQNTAIRTFGVVFSGGVTDTGEGVRITISEIRFGYDYRQPDERRPATGTEFMAPSTPSAEISMRVTFSAADGEVLYDTFRPPFPFEVRCPRSLDCSNVPRVLRVTRRAQQQSGMGNSKEAINRALHEAIQTYLLIAACEYAADLEARAEGGRIGAEEADLCRYTARGFELVTADSPSP